MQIAVLADVHGNLPALRAVLAALDRDPVDAIVVAGDVCGGPLVRDALELLEARPESLFWIAGNSERETVGVFDGGEIPDGSPGRGAAWSSGHLGRRWRDALASWPIAVTLDGVCFCHGSPRRDDEILTRGTPDPALAEALGDVPEALVVGGHTHQQMIRHVHAGLVYSPSSRTTSKDRSSRSSIPTGSRRSSSTPPDVGRTPVRPAWPDDRGAHARGVTRATGAGSLTLDDGVLAAGSHRPGDRRLPRHRSRDRRRAGSGGGPSGPRGSHRRRAVSGRRRTGE